MCNNRWNLPQEHCLGIESKEKNKMAALTEDHVTPPKMAAVWRRSPNGGRIEAQLVSIGVDWAFNWLLENGGESSRLLEFLWIRSKRKKRERLRPRRRGDASVKDLPYQPNRFWKSCWFESRMSRVVVAFLGHFEDFFLLGF